MSRVAAIKLVLKVAYFNTKGIDYDSIEFDYPHYFSRHSARVD